MNWIRLKPTGIYFKMDYEAINKTKVTELKAGAVENDVDVSGVCQAVLKTAEEIEGELSNGYSQKLINGSTTLPDPFK